MTNRFGRRVLWVVALICLVPATSDAQLQCQPCTVGVVLDGPWERNDEVRSVFEREVVDLVGSDFDVQFPADKRRLADWSLEGARRAVEDLLADPDVDIVLTSGPVASTYAGRRGNLAKPVVAAFILNPEVQGIPLATDDQNQRVSGVTNLSYITFPGQLPEEIQRFREVVPFRKLTLLTNEGLLTAVPELEANLRREIADLDLDLSVVRVGSSVDAALAAIPTDTEAVYVVPLIQLPPGDFSRLVQALIERRLPSFSFWGRPDVENGLLTSIYLGTDFERLGRRIAVNIQRILLGEDPGDIPVDFRRSRRLTINMRTARAIEVYPSWSVYTEAELIDDTREVLGRQIDLASVAREAVRVNLDLATSDRAIAAGAQEIRRARSSLLPQLGISTATQFIDQDRAESGFGGQPQRVLVGSTSLTQVLYSDPLRANVEIQRHVQSSREQRREQTRLDILADATIGYLNVLRAKTFERIQRQNLTITRSNLELAQARRQLGVARASEVIRWENQIANNRRDVIDSNAQRNIAEIALNRLLHRPLEESFDTRDASLEDSSLLTSARQLDPFLNNSRAFDLFRTFMAQESARHSPELKQLDAAILAQERALQSARRAFWAPTVALQADLSALAKGGPGSSPGLPGDLPFSFSFPSPNSVNWTVGLNASLPLFTGGARRAEQTQATEALQELRFKREATAERIEQRVRSALHQAGASYAGIQLSTDAADAARRNLVIVTDAYEQGAVSILDLLDAQNSQLVAELVAASAVYDYLLDLMAVQRAGGQFDFFLAPAEYQDLLARLRTYFGQAGYVPRGIE